MTPRLTTLIAGLAVALAAGVATAHGLYEVAVAAGAPRPIAGLYPLITDGLALVAYASTARLNGGGRNYAWTVVVLAAGLSGLAQASYLAGGVPSAPPALRFGVGAWPAVAAAITAHLLFLLATVERTPVRTPEQLDVQSVVQTLNGRKPPHLNIVANSIGVRPLYDSPASDRARTAAMSYRAQHGDWPTVTALEDLAQVSRGTAAKALKQLRANVNDPDHGTDPTDPRSTS